MPQCSGSPLCPGRGLFSANGSRIALPQGLVCGGCEVWGGTWGTLSPEEMEDEARKDGGSPSALSPPRPVAPSFSFTPVIGICLLGENNFSHTLVLIWSNSSKL